MGDASIPLYKLAGPDGPFAELDLGFQARQSRRYWEERHRCDRCHRVRHSINLCIKGCATDRSQKSCHSMEEARKALRGEA